MFQWAYVNWAVHWGLLINRLGLLTDYRIKNEDRTDVDGTDDSVIADTSKIADFANQSKLSEGKDRLIEDNGFLSGSEISVI